MRLTPGSKACLFRPPMNFIKCPVMLIITCVLLSMALEGCLREQTLRRQEGHKESECDRDADAALQNGDYARSIDLHQQFLVKNPGHSMALYHLGYAFGQAGNHEQEIEYYEKAINSGFDKDHLFFNLGMSYGEMHQYHDALRTFRKGLDVYPDNLDLRFGLATTLEAMGQYDKAINQLRKILDVDPDHQMAKEMLQRIQKNRQNN